MAASQHQQTPIDLSGSRWRQSRARTVVVNPVAPHGLRPSAGQLAGSGDDRLQLALDQPTQCVPAPIELGDRGSLLALLEWAQNRGVRTAPAAGAFAPGESPRPVAVRELLQVIDDIRQECATTRATAWGLFRAHCADEPIRVLLPTEPATILLATPTAAVGIGHDGLRLLRRHITVIGWRRTEEEILLTTPDGQRRFGKASLSAGLLDRLGRNSAQIDLREASMHAFLTPLVSSLNELLATDDGPRDALVTVRR